MSGFLKDDCDIDAVLGELEAGVSETDNTILSGIGDDGSEEEDNVEVELDYSEADVTDADPDYYPSDIERPPVLLQRRNHFIFHSETVADVPENDVSTVLG